MERAYIQVGVSLLPKSIYFGVCDGNAQWISRISGSRRGSSHMFDCDAKVEVSSKEWCAGVDGGN